MTGAEAEAVMTVLRALFDASQPSLLEESGSLPSLKLVVNRALFLHFKAAAVLTREKLVPEGFVPLTRAEMMRALPRVELPRPESAHRSLSPGRRLPTPPKRARG